MSYLATRELADAQSFYLNLSFELLTGCQYSCDGCHVNKNASVVLEEKDLDVLTQVLESATQGAYTVYTAFINPTDFLVSDNTLDVLQDARIIRVLSYFKKLSFQSTFLNIVNAPKIGSVLRKHYPNHELEFNILIEPDQVMNDKYLRTLRTNSRMVAKIFDWPTRIGYFGVMNVFDYSQTKRAQLLKDHDLIQERVKDLVSTTIDFNFSIARKGVRLTNEEFADSVLQVKRLYTGAVDKQASDAVQRLGLSKSTDALLERQYSWVNGRFYHSPLLYERYVSFLPAFEIPVPNASITDFESYEASIELQQYLNLDTKDECGACALLPSCVSKSILHLMDIHGLGRCPVAKDSLRIVNTMGALPV